MVKLRLAAMLIAVPLAGFEAPAAAAEEAASPHTFTANVGLFSDYRFRGISQTYEDPAIQGGFDYSHASGLYLGTWASNVSGNQYIGGNSMEWDLYGGYRLALGAVTLDAGLLYYWYPSARYAGTEEEYDTLEAYAAATWKWFTAKYSYTLTDYFGVNDITYAALGSGDSEGSGYAELNASYPLMEKLSVVGHIGNQSVSNYSDLDYTDWKLGLTYDLNGFILGAAWVDTDADDALYSVTGAKGTRKLGDSTVVLSVSRSF
jgi:uncharacterized protein (TIGR02001 family)